MAGRPRILLTGATGFVGRALARRLLAAGFELREAGRHPSGLTPDFFPADLAQVVDWAPVLREVDGVVHAAGFAHVPVSDLTRDALDLVRRVNTQAVGELAKAAAAAGVGRFVFLSTAKVLGESASRENPFHSASVPAPADAYSLSKLAAEERVAAQAGLPWVILRPPLIYGPGAKANFRRLLGWVRYGWPLPFGAVDNSRSLLCIDNLCSAVVLCLRHQDAVSKRFLLADGEPVSTPALIREMASALNCRARLLAVPPAWLGRLATGLGKKEEWARLSGSFVVDANEIATVLGWQPETGFAEGVRRAVLADDVAME